MECIADAVAATPWVDSHEHLLEPGTRAAGPGAHALQPCTDFALLFCHYALDDLVSAGMPEAARRRLREPAVPASEKWAVLEPWWRRCRHTGYLAAVGETLRLLFGVDPDALDAEACARVSEAMAEAAARPGFYRATLDRAGVLTCQVNTLERGLFMDTAEPDLLLQDLGAGVLSTNLDVPALRRRSGLAVADLEDWHAVIDWAFATCGPRAVALKSAAAYGRRLNYAPVSAATAAPLFARHLRGEALEGSERRALEDLFRHCLGRAQERGLPVKLHCGYYAGTGSMPLARVRHNAADVCTLLRDFPEARFVLMHVGYPYQDEYIALAKHYPNAHVDLCWAWIVNPAATVRFVREFLCAAPASKLLCFGGDYTTVENVVGHAAVARHGLTLALRSLVADGWMGEAAAVELVPRLMGDNARELFGLDGAGRLARGAAARA